MSQDDPVDVEGQVPIVATLENVTQKSVDDERTLNEIEQEADAVEVAEGNSDQYKDVKEGLYKAGVLLFTLLRYIVLLLVCIVSTVCQMFDNVAKQQAASLPYGTQQEQERRQGMKF